MNSYKTLALAFFAMFAIVVVSDAEQKNLTPADIRGQLFLPYYPSFDWIHAKWPDNDDKYVRREGEVTEAFKQKGKRQELMQKYQKEAMNDLSNSELFYRWAFALAVNTFGREVSALERQEFAGALSAGMRPISPHSYIRDSRNNRFFDLNRAHKLPAPVRSYRFSRIMFILGVRSGIWTSGKILRDYGVLSDRLLKVKPNDEMVKVCSVLLYQHGTRGGVIDTGLAVRHAKELELEHPEKREYKFLYAQSLDCDWDFWKDDSGVLKAMEVYREIIDTEPPGSKLARAAKINIGWERKGMAYWGQRRRSKRPR